MIWSTARTPTWAGAAEIAQLALELATTQPELVFRNPEKIEQGWKQMRADRAAFIEFFGSDELVLPPAEAQRRLNAYQLPSDFADAETVGVLYDQIDGLNFYDDYAMLC
jgi:hypothetical protein